MICPTSLSLALTQSCFRLAYLCLFCVCSGGHDEDDGDDEAVKGERLSEDHHKDECNQNILLSVGADTSITNNTDSETCSKRGKTAAEARCKLLVAESVVIGPFSGLVDNTCLV